MKTNATEQLDEPRLSAEAVVDRICLGVDRVARAILEGSLDQRLSTHLKAAAIDAHLLQAYVGQYEISSSRTFTVIKEGETLKALTTGRSTGELIPKSETEFIWFNPEMNVNAQVAFFTTRSLRKDVFGIDSILDLHKTPIPLQARFLIRVEPGY